MSCDAVSVGISEVPGLVVIEMVNGEGERVGVEEGSNDVGRSDVGEECIEVEVGSGQEGAAALVQIRGLLSRKARKRMFSRRLSDSVTPVDV